MANLWQWCNMKVRLPPLKKPPISPTTFPSNQTALTRHCLFKSATFKVIQVLSVASLVLTGCDNVDGAADSTQDKPALNDTSAPSQIEALDQPDSASANPSKKPLNVVSPDWGVSATLTAMGHPPIATGDMRVWDQWVAEPKLPSSVHDLGIRYLPNAELAAQLPVDLIIDNFFYEHSRGVYGDVPAQTVMFAAQGKTAKWSDYTAPTRKLGKIIGNPAQAEQYINQSQQRINQAGAKLQQRYPAIKKFAVVQFVDANNMRMYANNSLFNTVLTKMDKQLVALGEGNEWGFVPIQMGDLTQLEPDVCLLIIKPLNPITQQQIQDSLVWQRLGYGADPSTSDTSRCMTILPPVWIYGGMASLTSLADNLASATLVGGRAHDIK